MIVISVFQGTRRSFTYWWLYSNCLPWNIQSTKNYCTGKFYSPLDSLKLLTRTRYIDHFYMEITTLSIHVYMPLCPTNGLKLSPGKSTYIPSKCPVSTGPFSNSFWPHGDSQGVETIPRNWYGIGPRHIPLNAWCLKFAIFIQTTLNSGFYLCMMAGVRTSMVTRFLSRPRPCSPGSNFIQIFWGVAFRPIISPKHLNFYPNFD